MTLEKYQKKRNFDVSPEPKGDVLKDVKRDRMFVVQEHHASHLHYDLRLEISGVLKSWAVPKEPPTEKGLKRLAIQVEDHPIEYGKFEGSIPEGNYGAGTVKIWDNGELILEQNSDNKVLFELIGRKMVGRYTLIKVPKMGKNSWLLFRI